MTKLNNPAKPKAAKCAATENAASLPPFVSIPFTDAAARAPHTDAHRWLHDFGGWALEQSDEAQHALRFVDWQYPDAALNAIYTAKRLGIGKENFPLFEENVVSYEADDEVFKDFFVLCLEKARHEHTIERFNFWARATLQDVPQTSLDADRQSNFDAAFQTYLDTHEEKWARVKARWQNSGLTVEKLWEALRYCGETDAETEATAPR